MKAIGALQFAINGEILHGATDSKSLSISIYKEGIEEIEELHRENTALKITLDRLVIQDIDSSKIYHLEDKLTKAQKYIVELENQLKAKDDNVWMKK